MIFTASGLPSLRPSFLRFQMSVGESGGPDAGMVSDAHKKCSRRLMREASIQTGSTTGC